jgi:hypothetical protein
VTAAGSLPEAPDPMPLYAGCRDRDDPGDMIIIGKETEVDAVHSLATVRPKFFAHCRPGTKARPGGGAGQSDSAPGRRAGTRSPPGPAHSPSRDLTDREVALIVTDSNSWCDLPQGLDHDHKFVLNVSSRW